MRESKKVGRREMRRCKKIERRRGRRNDSRKKGR